jgi:pimeloyl-ACP methyl ester carboxylesterase
MRRLGRALIPMAAAIVATACARAQRTIDLPPHAEQSVWLDAAGHRNGRVAVDGTTIHYVDYGGTGPSLVFLAGLGNSAHVFDEFAPRFTNAFRVLALTRRGYGESGRPDGGYETARLAEDVRVVLDSLGVQQVILAGHSVAGDEITAFAASYPTRTSALVYLDAAYDRSGMTKRLVMLGLTKSLPPAQPRAADRDRVSVSSYRAYLSGLYGVEWPELEVRATRVFDGAGRYLRDASTASTSFDIMRGETPLAYDNVRAPVLAIYAVDRSIERDFPWLQRMSIGRGDAEQQARRAQRAQREWEANERKRLRDALPDARVVEVRDGSHYIFISHAGLVESEVRRFLEANVGVERVFCCSVGLKRRSG